MVATTGEIIAVTAITETRFPKTIVFFS